jgi:hypothetical protein
METLAANLAVVALDVDIIVLAGVILKSAPRVRFPTKRITGTQIRIYS